MSTREHLHMYHDINMVHINDQKNMYSELIVRQKGEIDHLSILTLRRDKLHITRLTVTSR